MIQRRWQCIRDPKQRSGFQNRMQGGIFIGPVEIFLTYPIKSILEIVPVEESGGRGTK
jgi:hypothetical protein